MPYHLSEILPKAKRIFQIGILRAEKIPNDENSAYHTPTPLKINMEA